MNNIQTVDMVMSCLQETLTENNEKIDVSNNYFNKSTQLLGRGSIIDSLGLVTLIVAIEQRLDEDFGIAVTIADERAMLQEKSPFRTIGSLSEYLELLIEEQGQHD